ncbi:MAG: hypothetical protein V1934_04280 [Methanobacteriota archaeon]
MKNLRSQLDYEKITIYPRDYDGSVRQKLYEALTALGVRFDYEQYA